MEGSEITEVAQRVDDDDLSLKKKIFVAGATGSTGKRIVEQLLAKGFAVKAGVRDLDKAKTTLSSSNPSLQFVRVDVTDGSDKLAEAIGDDTEAVVCATGFRPGWDLLAPWKVDNFGTVNLVEACRKVNVNRFILISSILVNGAAVGQLPIYLTSLRLPIHLTNHHHHRSTIQFLRANFPLIPLSNRHSLLNILQHTSPHRSHHQYLRLYFFSITISTFAYVSSRRLQRLHLEHRHRLLQCHLEHRQ